MARWANLGTRLANVSLNITNSAKVSRNQERMKIAIRQALEKDALAICRLRKKVWLASYVRPELGFTKEKILECYRFTDKESIEEYREMLLVAQACAEQPELASAGYAAIGFWVAEAHLLKGYKKMVGFASAERKDNCLTMLYIDPLYQRRGIGNMLMEKIRDFLDEKRDTVLTVVDFNEQAQNFYHKHGFIIDEKASQSAHCGALFGAKGMRSLAN